TSVGLVTKDLDQSVLDTLATETGARSVPVAQSAQLAGAFSAVARDIASQYVLTYTSTAATPRELELSVAVTVSGVKVEDAIAVLNPRSVAPPPGEAAEGEHVGVFGSSLGLYVGLGAAFLAIALLLGMVFSRTRGGAAVRVLRRGLRLYTRGQKKEPEASAMTTALGRRVVELVDQAPKPKGYEDKVQIRLDRAGWPLRASEFLVLRGLGAVIGILLGLGLLGLWWLGLVLMVIGVMIPELILRQRTEKRNAAFMEQLPGTLQLLAGSLQAGYGLVQAIDTVARESRPPTSVEYGRALTETRLGMPLEEALEGMAERIGGEDFRWVVLAINIQRQVGGNLAALLETVSATLREREQLRRQVKVLSAEGRLSAIILTALPILLVAYMSVVNPSYIGTLTHYTIGKVMIVGGIGLLIVGMVWMRKMIRIEV
ncbi:MAG: type II secretion system F family protein, partial [Actinomycetota bacterium]